MDTSKRSRSDTGPASSTRERVRELLSEGITPREIALRLGLTTQAIYAQMRILHGHVSELPPPVKGLTSEGARSRIATRIKGLREQRELSQEFLGALAGVTRETIRSVELGKQDLRLSTLTAIAMALNVEVIELIGEEVAS